MAEPAPAQPPALVWGLHDRRPADIRVETDSIGVSPEWAWGGATGRGVRVCVIDSGVVSDHPQVGGIQGSFEVRTDDAGTRVERCDPEDANGHGTACAGIIRRMSPECEIHSIRILGKDLRGSGDALVAGLSWAVQEKYDVINMSLSTSKRKFTDELYRLADAAYFGRSILVASAHNSRVESFPWRFASVISVGSHREEDPELFLSNPHPPVEFFGHGQNVEVPWFRGGTVRMTGNSFATPAVAGLCARILSKHPALTAAQLKNILYMTAENVFPALEENHD